VQNSIAGQGQGVAIEDWLALSILESFTTETRAVAGHIDYEIEFVGTVGSECTSELWCRGALCEVALTDESKQSPQEQSARSTRRWDGHRRSRSGAMTTRACGPQD
jgi:hypothetical protein